MNLRPRMVNENYQPSADEETILELFTGGCGTGGPWGRANPLYFRERTQLDKGQVEYALSNLTTAGWIAKLNAGLYEFVEDPRDNSRQEAHDSKHDRNDD